MSVNAETFIKNNICQCNIKNEKVECLKTREDIKEHSIIGKTVDIENKFLEIDILLIEVLFRDANDVITKTMNKRRK